MKVERFNAKPLSPEELRELERLRVLIERMIAGGYVTGVEVETIKAQIRADGKVLVEEIELYQHLVWDKIQEGEIEYRW